MFELEENSIYAKSIKVLYTKATPLSITLIDTEATPPLVRLRPSQKGNASVKKTD